MNEAKIPYNLNIFLNKDAEEAPDKPGHKKISYLWYAMDKGFWVPDPEPVTLSKSTNQVTFAFGDMFKELDDDTTFTIQFSSSPGCPCDAATCQALAGGMKSRAQMQGFLGLQGLVKVWAFGPFDLANLGTNFTF
jgi:hypothetical protein